MIIKYFKKMGGWQLIKLWLHNHVFLYAIKMFFVLPKNRFGLEILNECIERKKYIHLKHEFRHLIDQCETFSTSKNTDKNLWFCWLQGIDDAPELVKINYSRLKRFFPNYKINLITYDNFQEFTSIPEYIIKKWRSGIISNTHFSDILRTNLLVLPGGIWIDATVYISNTLPTDIRNSRFFLFRTQKPGCAGKCITVSSWFISSEVAHPVMLLVQDMIFYYWNKHNYLYDYFLFHLCLEIALEKFETLTNDMPKYTNETPHYLLYELTNAYDSDKFKYIIDKSFAHKLTTKLSEEQKNMKETVYQYLLCEDKNG